MNREGRTNRTEQPRRPSATRAQSRAKVDKGSPSRTVIQAGEEGEDGKKGWLKRRRSKSEEKILSTPLGNRRAVERRREERMRTRDERAEREREIDGTNG